MMRLLEGITFQRSNGLPRRWGGSPLTKHGSLDWNVYMSIITQVKVNNEIRRAYNERQESSL